MVKLTIYINESLILCQHVVTVLQGKIKWGKEYLVYFQGATPSPRAPLISTLLYLINDQMELVTKRSQISKRISDLNVINDQEVTSCQKEISNHNVISDQGATN